MTVHVPFDLAYEMDVRADADAVYAVLADVPLSASHFPGLERLVDLGGNRYRWELAKLGTEHVHLQTVYASRYHCDRQRRSVRWEPVAGEGNARVGGRWVIEPRPQGTHLRLELAGDISHSQVSLYVSGKCSLRGTLGSAGYSFTPDYLAGVSCCLLLSDRRSGCIPVIDT